MALALQLTPGGRLTVAGDDQWRTAIDAEGLLAFLRNDAPAEAEASFRFFRRVAREFAVRLGRIGETGDETGFHAAQLPDELIEALLYERPPMIGGEYLDANLLRQLLEDLELAAVNAWHQAGGTISPAAWLRTLNPAWSAVGKVTFHLAENKNDPTGRLPFLFLVTYIQRLGEDDRPRHLPLGAAVRALAGEPAALLPLLKPIREAGVLCPLLQRMLDDQRIYDAAPWTAGEAYEFLDALPRFEELGIQVRIVNLWKKRPPRLQVNLTVEAGPKKGFLATEGLLRFSAEATLGGIPLAAEELERLLQETPGLIRFKGEWVDADPVKIAKLLNVWNHAARMAEQSGIPFVAGMRLLAGVKPGRGMPEPDAELCTVTAAAGLETCLRELSPPGALPPLPTALHAILRPYQREGVEFLCRLTTLGFGVCLADDMGLGKTLQVLTFLELLRESGALSPVPALLVLPASLLPNWRQEAEKFTPQLRVAVFHPSAMSKEEFRRFEETPDFRYSSCDVLLTTYGMLSRSRRLGDTRYPAVIVDEAQAIKNPESQQSKIIRNLQAVRRVALTGTPVENKPGDLWSIYDFLNPGLLGTAAEFQELLRKLDPGGGAKADYTPLRKLVAPTILRRLKSDRRIIKDLPDKTELNVFCRLTPKQAAVYQQAVETLKNELNGTEDSQRKGVVLKYLLQFKQICNHPDQYVGGGAYLMKESGKFERLAELAEELASRQDKLLVFTQFRELCEPLHDLLAKVWGRPGFILHGGTPIPRRGEMVRAFQEESGPPFFVLSLKAAGTGLNLTAANHGVHFDRWWNPAVENQATDRAYRIGQHRNVLVHKFLCGGTIESKIDRMIAQKRYLADSLLAVGSGPHWSELSDAELLELVKLDLHSMEEIS